MAQESALELHDLLPVGLVPAQQLLRLLHDRVVVVLLLLHFVVLGGGGSKLLYTKTGGLLQLFIYSF